MPTFLHTSDLHLNALRRFSQFYLGRAKACLRHIQNIAEDREVDFIVVAGDIYDRRDITHAERLLLSEWLAECRVPVVMVSGNHDKRSAEVGDTCLSYLSAFAQRLGNHLVHDGEPRVYERFGCYLVLMPYQGWMDQELFLIVQALLEDYCTNPDLPVVVVLHEAVQGCKTDVGLSITKANQIRIDNNLPSVTYWAMGDMHICQSLLDCAWYSGSPHQTRFDEVAEKGVLIVDTNRPADPEFVPVPSIPLRIVTEELEDWPPPEEALIQFRPEGPFPENALPLNVEFHPSVVSLARRQDRDQQMVTVGIFDDLETALERAHLPEDLYPLAWRIAIKLAKTAGVTVELPDRYQVQDNNEQG
jgi:DNA repair exonuclease SbcCD nuclease subunit